MRRIARAILGPSFIWYVAWRYLLSRPRRFSSIFFVILLIELALFLSLLLAVPLQALTLNYLEPAVILRPWEPVMLGFGVMAMPIFVIAGLGRRYIFRKPVRTLPWLGFLGSGTALLVFGPHRAADAVIATWGALTPFWPLGFFLIGVLGILSASANGAKLAAVLWTITGLVVILLYTTLIVMVANEMGDFDLAARPPMWLVFTLIGIGMLVALTAVLAIIRYIFTFFTSVSIGGVMIGGTALVIVLSVMGGFENHLRSRILGSNAHMLVTRADDQKFTEYRAVEKQIATIPGITGHSPYLQSEVVLAANSSYDSAIIKGVDPDTVGTVTDLAKNVEDPHAIERMWPLKPSGDPLPRREKPALAPSAPSGASDPAPPDMELPDDEPTDLSIRQRGKVRDPAPTDMELPEDDRPTDFSGGEIHMARVPDKAAKETDAEVMALPGILVGRELANHLNLYEGQEVRLVSPFGEDTPVGQVPRTKRARVADRFYTGMYQYDLKYIYIELGALQEFLDLGDQVNGIEIRIQEPDRTLPVKAALENVLGPSYRVTDWKEINRSLFSALKIEKMAMFLVLVVIILVASFSIMGNLIMTVYEKGREISILKTIGASLPEIVRVFVVQGFFIGLVGTTVGVGLGLLACWLNMTVGVPIPPEVYYMDRLPTHVEPWAVFWIALAGVLISVLATIYPAYLASRMDVVAGLRKE